MPRRRAKPALGTVAEAGRPDSTPQPPDPITLGELIELVTNYEDAYNRYRRAAEQGDFVSAMRDSQLSTALATRYTTVKGWGRVQGLHDRLGKGAVVPADFLRREIRGRLTNPSGGALTLPEVNALWLDEAMDLIDARHAPVDRTMPIPAEPADSAAAVWITTKEAIAAAKQQGETIKPYHITRAVRGGTLTRRPTMRGGARYEIRRPDFLDWLQSRRSGPGGD